MGKVSEYDDTGKEVWSVNSPGCWAATRLKNGNTLVSGNRYVREFTPDGQTAWEFTSALMPDYRVDQFQVAKRLANGNTLVNNWGNAYTGRGEINLATAQAWEITPDKKVVWVLDSWKDPNLGPATIIQILDDPLPPETGHFGSIK
jgi:hypothetical protein